MRQLARGMWKKAVPNLGDALIVLGILALSTPLIWSLRSSYMQEREEQKWNAEQQWRTEQPGQPGQPGQAPQAERPKAPERVEADDEGQDQAVPPSPYPWP